MFADLCFFMCEFSLSMCNMHVKIISTGIIGYFLYQVMHIWKLLFLIFFNRSVFLEFTPGYVMCSIVFQRRTFAYC